LDISDNENYRLGNRAGGTTVRPMGQRSVGILPAEYEAKSGRRVQDTSGKGKAEISGRPGRSFLKLSFCCHNQGGRKYGIVPEAFDQ
jgi:hypothetical protein